MTDRLHEAQIISDILCYTFLGFSGNHSKKQIRSNIAANIYLWKVNNRNTRKRCEICSKLIVKTPERHH